MWAAAYFVPLVIYERKKCLGDLSLVFMFGSLTLKRLFEKKTMTRQKILKIKTNTFWTKVMSYHRHLSNTDCLMACTAYLVCFICTVNGHSKKKKPIKAGASSGHTTNLKQSILESFDIYVSYRTGMGEISKQRQLNEKMRYGVVRDLGFYETRWILKFSFNQCLINMIKIFYIWLEPMIEL